MNKPFTTFLKLMLLALALGTGFTSQAQVTYSQVPLTASSFTADVIANGTAALPPTSSTTADVDGSGYYFISQDYYTSSTAHTSGLPNTGTIPNSISGYSALTYQLASFNGNNALRIPGGATGSGTVTFATPTAASEVYVLATSGAAISTVTMTVNYSDGSTTAFAGQSVPDWFTVSAATNVFGMSARANSTTPVSAPNAANTAPFFNQFKLTIPTGKVSTTITGISFNKTSTGGYLQVMAVSVGTYPACSGTPPTATATTSASAPCATSGFTLDATGVNASTGLTYQWQSSPTGANTFTNLGSAQTTSAYNVASQAASSDYRVVITCANSSLSSTSSPVTVTRGYLSCYCTTYNGPANEYITSVTLPGTNGFTNNSTNPSTSPPGYNDYTGNSSLTTTVNQGATYVNGLGLSVRSNNTNSQGAIWIDYDHSGTFDASEYLLIGTSNAIATIVSFTQTLAIPSNAQLGPTRVRVRWRNGSFAGTDACTGTSGSIWYGETEDYLINIAAPANCSAPPASVTATADVTNACANSSFNLSTASVPTTQGGYTYQWQSRTGTNPFADIAGATTNPYSVPSQTVATDYQLVVSCQYGGTPVTSNVVPVGQNSFDQCYCTTSSTNGCSQYGSITNVSIGTLNNASGCSGTTYTMFPATGVLDMGQPATLTLNVAQAATFSYRYAAWIDYNHNGTFDTSEFVASGAPSNSPTATATFNIPAASASALSGITRMRVRTNAGILSYGNFSAGDCCTVTYNGETEDYLVQLNGPLPVELVRFSAEARSNAVRLDWATALEKNSDRFEIERSADGKTFEHIGVVAAQGSSSKPIDYTFLDAQYAGKAATRYYRLRQVDTDGSASFSPVRAVQLGGTTRLELYPNPAHGSLTVTNATAGMAVEVLDALGRSVLTAPAAADGTARLTLPAWLPGGVYLVRNGSEVRRLTVE